jgi:hypothetical protein
VKRPRGSLEGPPFLPYIIMNKKIKLFIHDDVRKKRIMLVSGGYILLSVYLGLAQGLL